MNINKAILTWGRLLRVPNLLTLPGDIIAGAAWAGPAIISLPVLFSLCSVILLYCAGLLLNDYFDRNIDAAERPERPIPSGAISATHVLTVGIIFLGAGIFLGFLPGMHTGITAAAIAILIMLYDSGGKNIPVAGPLLIGLCRGGAVVMGIFSLNGQIPSTVWIIPVFSIYYILAVTVVAAKECEKGKPGMRIFYPVIPIGAALVSVPFLFEKNIFTYAGLLFFAYSALKITMKGRMVNIKGTPVPPFIGFSLRTYILLQGAWALLLFPVHNQAIFSALIMIFLIMRLISEFASRKFYGS